MAINSPIKYRGAKGRWAAEVWRRFGDDIQIYAEPFVGSAAVLLARPNPVGREVINDSSGYIANLWRALRADPYGVADWCDYPNFHADFYARHLWLVKWSNENALRLMEDDEYYDSKAAGYFIFGINLAIGDFCISDEVKYDSIPYLGFLGGIKTMPQRKLFGKMPVGTGDRLFDWFFEISQRFGKITTITNRDWSSLVTDTVLRHTETSEKLPTAVFLGPTVSEPTQARQAISTARM